jgi:hypothetical protein
MSSVSADECFLQALTRSRLVGLFIGRSLILFDVTAVYALQTTTIIALEGQEERYLRHWSRLQAKDYISNLTLSRSTPYFLYRITHLGYCI